jgi:hypothetical protein
MLRFAATEILAQTAIISRLIRRSHEGRGQMTAEHLVWHVGALCLLLVIAGTATILARPEVVYRR